MDRKKPLFRRVFEHGDSLAVVIPHDLCEELHIDTGTLCGWVSASGKMLCIPYKPKVIHAGEHGEAVEVSTQVPF